MSVSDNLQSLITILESALEHVPAATKKILTVAAQANIPQLIDFVNKAKLPDCTKIPNVDGVPPVDPSK